MPATTSLQLQIIKLLLNSSSEDYAENICSDLSNIIDFFRDWKQKFAQFMFNIKISENTKIVINAFKEYFDKEFGSTTAPPLLAFAFLENNHYYINYLLMQNYNVNLREQFFIMMLFYLKYEIIEEKWKTDSDARAQMYEMAKSLFAFKIRPIVPISWRELPLSWAVRHDLVDLVKLFIENSANIHASGNHAISEALKHNNKPMVQLLLRYGADLTSSKEKMLKVVDPRLMPWLREYYESAVPPARNGMSMI